MKKFISFIMVVCILAASILVVPVAATESNANATVSKWDGDLTNQTVTATSVGELGFEGSGTQDAPYLLKNAEDVEKLAIFVAAGHDCWGVQFRLECDIDIDSKAWPGIGSATAQFKGKFDGNDHVIYNLNLASGSSMGFFGYVATNGSQISNLGIASGTIEVVASAAGSYVGSLIGYASKVASIENCFSNAKMKVTTQGKAYVGGLIGYALTCPTVKNCFSNAEIDVSAGAETYVGGLIGCMDYQVNVDNCFNIGNINVTTNTTSVVHTVGGLVGTMNENTIANSFNAGDITVTKNDVKQVKVGGLIGAISGGAVSTINGCVQLGNINIPGSVSNDSIASFVGDTARGMKIANSCAGGSISVGTDPETNPAYIGVIAGGDWTDGSTYVVENCSYSCGYTLNGQISTLKLFGGTSNTATINGFTQNDAPITTVRSATAMVNNAAQNGTHGETYKNSVRFVSELTFSAAAFKECGFVVEIVSGDAETSTPLSGKVVYKSLEAAGETVTPEDGKSFIAYGISDIPDGTDATFKVTPYVVTLNGVTVYGAQSTVTMTDGDVSPAN